MEVDEIQSQGCTKFPRISNGNGRFDDGEVTKRGRDGRLCGWPTSRIVRVSRASGGKDRHSKVWTSKGLRDRRVRLSVNTAIQFYDLQDRLGYDQPSKAVEWLLKAAASSISDLPCLDPLFPENSTEDKKSSACTDQHGGGGAVDSTEVETEGNRHHHHQQNLPRSACSSTSETSRGSGLSLSRSESRVKARERARERAAEKEKVESSKPMRRIPQNSSFTELLTGGMSNNNNNNTTPTGRGSETNFFSKSPFDYFPSTSGFQAQIHLGNPIQHPLSASSPVFGITGDHHPELQHHFPFVSDHLVPVGAGGTNGHANNISNEYNLNFSISSSSSSGLAGYNRGTLQSNSSSSLASSLLPHFQRYDGSLSFFNGSSDDNHHHHFLSAYDARLQLFNRHSDPKGQGKN